MDNKLDTQYRSEENEALNYRATLKFTQYIESENPQEVSFMEIKNVKVSKLENKELLDVKKQVESFLKFLNSEYDTVKKLEEENS